MIKDQLDIDESNPLLVVYSGEAEKATWLKVAFRTYKKKNNKQKQNQKTPKKRDFLSASFIIKKVLYTA